MEEEDETEKQQQKDPNHSRAHVTFRDNVEQRYNLPPIFPIHSVDQEGEEKEKNNKATTTEEEEEQQPYSRKKALLDYLHAKLPRRVVHRVLKCTLAYFLTTLFSLVHPLTVFVGRSVFLTTTGSIFNHPGRRYYYYYY